MSEPLRSFLVDVSIRGGGGYMEYWRCDMSLLHAFGSTRFGEGGDIITCLSKQTKGSF